ncbi:MULTISPECIES: fimbrial protein [unclassified Serratia (in: enterobacteria)]|uniref:fimbrial protein n=1 Tax=unclassified Serratia (in: enterobacteria) TaxID=2647522 RepID=UPI002ED393A4|nr:fimbrial protein [Serratia sp. C2(2)]MEE4449982.1 fimbrial protein [Serratia sp. C2(1)]
MNRDVLTRSTLACITTGLLCMLSPAQAVDVNFRGQLVESIPCEVNSGGLIEVNFDNVIIRGIDGVQYRQPVPYLITCTGLGSVRLRVQGTAVGFDNAAVVTDKTGLGIRIEQNGTPMRLNQPIPVDLATPPTLTAVPVANPASPPVAGTFVARATIVADYQ